LTVVMTGRDQQVLALILTGLLWAAYYVLCERVFTSRGK
jgi:hypothetical protein